MMIHFKLMTLGFTPGVKRLKVRTVGDLVSKETVCCVGGIHSDEGLTLETSVFESFTLANHDLPYRPCG